MRSAAPVVETAPPGEPGIVAMKASASTLARAISVRASRTFSRMSSAPAVCVAERERGIGIDPHRRGEIMAGHGELHGVGPR